MAHLEQTRLASLDRQGSRLDDIGHNIRLFVVENLLFGQGEAQFSNEDSFLEKGLIDSVGILTLVEFVRESYAISIEDEELVPENWDSVHRIAATAGPRKTPKTSAVVAAQSGKLGL